MPRALIDARSGFALLAVVASVFSYFHIERITMPRVPLIPGGAILPLARFAPGFVAMLALLGLLLGGRQPAHLRRRAPIRSAVAVLTALQVAYFHVDYFDGDRARLLHVSLVLLGTVGLVVMIRHIILERRMFESLAVASMLTVASLQFAYFYADYFTDYRRRAYYPEGEVRTVLEDVILRARGQSVPAVHFWDFGSHGLQNISWKFYLAKHERDDLLARTTRSDEKGAAASERLRQLPSGSLVVTRPSSHASDVLDPMVQAMELKSAALFRSPDGAPIFQILERAGR